jgi:hypothetical protein
MEWNSALLPAFHTRTKKSGQQQLKSSQTKRNFSSGCAVMMSIQALISLANSGSFDKLVGS